MMYLGIAVGSKTGGVWSQPGQWRGRRGPWWKLCPMSHSCSYSWTSFRTFPHPFPSNTNIQKYKHDTGWFLRSLPTQTCNTIPKIIPAKMHPPSPGCAAQNHPFPRSPDTLWFSLHSYTIPIPCSFRRIHFSFTNVSVKSMSHSGKKKKTNHCKIYCKD